MKRRAKIPFWATFRAAHVSILRNAGAGARIVLPLLLVYAAFLVAINWLRFPVDPSELISATDSAFIVVDELAGVALFAIAAVRWHRLILLGEQPAWNSSPWRKGTLSKYLLAAAVIWAATSLPIYAIMHGFDAAAPDIFSEDVEQNIGNTSDGQNAEAGAPTGQSDENRWLIALLVPIVLVPLLPVIALLSFVPMRLSLALPALALGDLETPFARAWSLSRGNFWRLFWGSGLTATLALATIIAGVAKGDEAVRASFIIWNAATSIAIFLTSLIWAGFLSHAYRALAPEAIRPA